MTKMQAGSQPARPPELLATYTSLVSSTSSLLQTTTLSISCQYLASGCILFRLCLSAAVAGKFTKLCYWFQLAGEQAISYFCFRPLRYEIPKVENV